MILLQARRWVRLSLAIVFIMLFGVIAGAAEEVVITSPDGKVSGCLSVDGSGRVVYGLQYGKAGVIENSPMGITVDGVDLGQGVGIGQPERAVVDEKYPWRGVKSEAVDHYNSIRIPVEQQSSGLKWILEARAYDDGFAYRYVVPGEGTRLVQGESSCWRLPAGSKIWYQTSTRHYEGVYVAEQIEAVKEGVLMGPPVTVELPGGGYMAITEGRLINYSGMTVQATGSTLLKAVFEDDPDGWKIEGEIRTPWRIVMVGADLNTLVNCDIVHNVCPPADKTLFPDGIHTDWVKPGRTVWSWLNGERKWVTVRNMKFYNELAEELGFEYNLVDAGWDAWRQGNLDQWSLMKEVVDNAREHNVKIWVWEHIKNLTTHQQREEYFKRCRDIGVVGLKIDFINSESQDMVNWYHDTLKEAAEQKLMVSFHGSNKPTGEPRTWPNEMSRESVHGLEHRPPFAYYDTICPFTRLLAGHADTTPIQFGRKVGDTSWAHQIANAVIVTSPLLCLAEHPMELLINNFGEFVGSIPTVWDETIVLPISQIGQVAGYARRQGDVWFVGIVNGPQQERTVKVDLSFLGRGKYQATMIRDNMGDAFDIIWKRLENYDRAIPVEVIEASESLEIQMRSGGGFAASFKRIQS